MQVSAIASLSAAQVPGQGDALPDTPSNHRPGAAVTPLTAAREGGSAAAKAPPAQFWRGLNGPDPATHVAPPSIMQIKISQLLDAQADGAEAPSDEAEPLPEAEPPGQGPASSAPESPPPGDAARQGYEGSASLLRDAPAAPEPAASPAAQPEGGAPALPGPASA